VDWSSTIRIFVGLAWSACVGRFARLDGTLSSSQVSGQEGNPGKASLDLCHDSIFDSRISDSRIKLLHRINYLLRHEDATGFAFSKNASIDAALRRI